jgi:protoporphyrinogen IX oxidase
VLILWIKALHLIFMVTWFAGLFYLPRLFVYHAMSTDTPSIERFKIMERKLFWGITTPGGVLTTIFGLWLLFAYAWQANKHMKWLHLKLTLVILLIIYHVWCGKLLRDFKHDRNTRSHRWYRVFNEVPTLILFAIIVLVIVRPF